MGRRARQPLLTTDVADVPASRSTAAIADMTDAGQCLIADAEEDAALWPWRFLLLGITVAWGANFAIVKLAADALGGAPEDLALFTAARFVIGFGLLSPSLAFVSTRSVISAGASAGALCTVGYGAQVASLALGSQAGTAAFICSLNAVVVAVLVGQKTGCVSPRTWWAIAFSVAGVGCLELPSIIGSGAGGICIGDLVAIGQPLGFGASYVVIEQALADHPEDELPLAALQVMVTCAASLASASVAFGAPLWDLPWESLLPHAPSIDYAIASDSSSADMAAAMSEATSSSWLGAGVVSGWSVAAPLVYSGVITTALTIWLQMLVFAKLPAVDASVLLTTEPLWAAIAAVLLLGDRLGPSDYAGGLLILLALAVNQGLLFSGVGPRLTYDMKSKGTGA